MPSRKSSVKNKPVGRLKQNRERKHSEETLRESEENFRVLFNENPLPTVMSEMPSGTIAFANKRMAEILGMPPEDIIGKTANDLGLLKNPADQEKLTRLIVSQGHVDNLEVEKVFPDGSHGTDLVSMRLVTINGKQYCLTVIQDITERKHAEDELRESEERFSKAFKTSPYAYMIANMKDGGIIEVNDAFTTMSGFTREEALAGSTLSLKLWVDEKDRQVMVATLRDGRAVKRLETRLQGKNGNIKTVLLSAQVIQLGNRPCILSIVEDITERKHMEQKLRESESNYRTLMEQASDAIFISDKEGNYTDANVRACTMFGYSREEILHLGMKDLLLPEEIAATPIKFEELRSGEAVLSERRMRRKDGSIVYTEISGKMIGDGRLQGIVRDITERKKTESLLMNAQKLDSLGVLAGGIAHDFNNLLTGIFGYIDLARSVSKEARTLDYLESTIATMNRARALTLQLLTFAKGGSPVQKITPLIPFIQEAVHFALSGSNISCRFSLAENLWPCNIDKNQIGQVIDNIVINAQQAMPNGGAIEITAENVTLTENEHPMLRPLNPPKGDLTDGVPPSGEPMGRGREVRNYVKVSIKDSGIGIPKDIMPRIFDPFYTTKTKGHGLGLATCYSIINRHGGCIDVESEPGTGSIFHVYLPASTEAVAADKAAGIQHRGSGTIIVIDDEEVVRDTIRKMLESMGYTVVCKNDGKEAIGFFMSETAKRRIAAMIFDLTIPGGMGGTEAVTEIRKLDKEIPVFVASGYADNSVMMDPVEYGFTASICKPFTIAELSEMLNRNLKK